MLSESVFSWRLRRWVKTLLRVRSCLLTLTSIEVHNHGSAGFSISLDVSSGWSALGGPGFCYWDPTLRRWCTSETSARSPIYRWPDSVYLANPPEGTSTKSYGFAVRPGVGTFGLSDGTFIYSDDLEIDVTVFIEVTDGSVSAIYCWVSYPSTYYGPYRLESYYPYLLYQGTWYSNGFWYSD